MDIASDITRRHSLTIDSPIVWLYFISGKFSFNIQKHIYYFFSFLVTGSMSGKPVSKICNRKGSFHVCSWIHTWWIWNWVLGLLSQSNTVQSYSTDLALEFQMSHKGAFYLWKATIFVPIGGYEWKVVLFGILLMLYV